MGNTIPETPEDREDCEYRGSIIEIYTSSSFRGLGWTQCYKTKEKALEEGYAKAERLYHERDDLHGWVQVRIERCD